MGNLSKKIAGILAVRYFLKEMSEKASNISWPKKRPKQQKYCNSRDHQNNQSSRPDDKNRCSVTAPKLITKQTINMLKKQETRHGMLFERE